MKCDWTIRDRLRRAEYWPEQNKVCSRHKLNGIRSMYAKCQGGNKLISKEFIVEACAWITTCMPLNIIYFWKWLIRNASHFIYYLIRFLSECAKTLNSFRYGLVLFISRSKCPSVRIRWNQCILLNYFQRATFQKPMFVLYFIFPFCERLHAVIYCCVLVAPETFVLSGV